MTLIFNKWNLTFQIKAYEMFRLLMKSVYYNQKPVYHLRITAKHDICPFATTDGLNILPSGLVVNYGGGVQSFFPCKSYKILVQNGAFWCILLTFLEFAGQMLLPFWENYAFGVVKFSCLLTNPNVSLNHVTQYQEWGTIHEDSP